MAQRSHVPKFGNWEGEVPYTAYFDKARKGRTGGKMINPNDPEENPDLLSEDADAAQAPPSNAIAEPEDPIGRGPTRRSREHQKSREDSDNMNRGAPTEATNQRHGGRGASSGENYRRPGRPSAGSENSFDRSPLHPQARNPGRVTGAGSPAREGRGSYESTQGTPGRSRMRPNAKGDESPDKGAAVPRFGEWDENNPASADGYTHIFNKVREERHSTFPVQGTPSDQSHGNVRRPTANDSAKSCCFPWGRK